eukprot:Opistho-2@64993
MSENGSNHASQPQLTNEKEIPDGVMPLFFTSQSCELFNCKPGVQVTAEHPYVLIKKDAVIDDFKNRAAISDFHPAKEQLLKYPGDEILMVYDEDFKYGENFYICLTEEAKALLLKVPEEAPAVVETVDAPKQRPPEWISLGSDKEIDAESCQNTRELVITTVLRKRKEFGRPFLFRDRGPRDSKDGYVEYKSYSDKNFDIRILELDKGIQAVPIVVESMCQTNWLQPVDAAIEYEPREYDEEKQKEILESAELGQFVENVRLRFERALQQNEIMDVFNDDLVDIGDEEGLFGAKSDSILKEHQSFTDLKFSKDKSISCIDWHPTIRGVVAVSCTERLTFDERVTDAARVLMTPSLILVWSFQDPIHPQLILEAPDDVTVFRFNPLEPHLLAGGCMNGQLVLWDLTEYTEQLVSQLPTKELFGDDDKKELHTAIVKHTVVSSIESSHKAAITDLHWLPADAEVTATGEVIENEDKKCHQLGTIAADGTLLVWDTRGNKRDHMKSLKNLDLIWRPLMKVTLNRPDIAGEFGGTKFVLPRPLASQAHHHESALDRVSHGDDPHHLRGGSAGRSRKKLDIPTHSTKFFAGTEDGELVYMDWRVEKDHESGKIIPTKAEQFWRGHSGAVSALQRSPFFKDLLLGVGAWTFSIWKEDIRGSPLLISPCSQTYMTGGCWSPSRPGVFYIAKADGNVDVWDILDRSHEPAMTQNVSSFPIKSISPVQVSQHSQATRLQFLAIGDDAGTLHILEVPRSLTRPSSNEVAAVENFFEREAKRVHYMLDRNRVRADEKRNMDGNVPRAKGESGTEDVVEVEFHNRADNEYAEYLKMEQEFLDELGVRPAWQGGSGGLDEEPGAK